MQVLSWIKVLFIEFFLTLATIFIFPIVKMFIKEKKSENNNQKPILLVHGYLHNSFVWFYHKKRLEKEGLGPIYTIDLKKPLSSIEEHIKTLQLRVEEIVRKEKKPLTLIGHSMGGLISASLAVKMKQNNMIKEVITIGSPLQGTKLAFLGMGKASKEMEYNSDFVKELKKHLLVDNKIPFYHIATKTDQLVQPYDSAIINKNSQFVLEGIGHASLLFSRKVNQKLVEHLKIH